MTKRLTLIAVFILTVTLGVSTSWAAQAAADATVVVHGAPLQVLEINPFNFSLQRQPGMDTATSVVNLYMCQEGGLQCNGANWKQYFVSNTVQFGCFKVSGEPSSRVQISLTLPTTVGPVTFVEAEPRVRRALNCTEGGNPTDTISQFNGNYNGKATLDSQGEMYVQWSIHRTTNPYLSSYWDPVVSFSNLQNGSFSATAVLTVDYVY